MKINLNWANTHLSEYGEEYALYHNYYTGKHETYLKGLKTYRHLKDLLNGTKTNVCQSVVDIIANRIELDGLTVPDDAGINEFITDYFHKMRVGSVLNCAIRDALIYGDSYLALWFDKNNNLKLFNKNPMTTAVLYNAEDEIEMGVSCKYYKDENNRDRTRMFVYTKDIIGFDDYEGNFFRNEIELIPENTYKNPLNAVPIFHFCNGNAKTAWGESELSNVIPLQRNLNAFLQLRAVAGESSAFKQRYILNYTPDYDENGKEINPFENNSVGHVFITKGENVTVGEWSETPLSNFTDVIDSLHREISIITRIPQFMFTLGGNIPTSGLALKIAEQPLTYKIKNKQLIFGDVIEDIFDVILSYNGYSGYSQLESVWKNITVSDELQDVQIAANKIALGVESEIVLKELGYDASQLSIEQNGL